MLKLWPEAVLVLPLCARFWLCNQCIPEQIQAAQDVPALTIVPCLSKPMDLAGSRRSRSCRVSGALFTTCLLPDKDGACAGVAMPSGMSAVCTVKQAGAGSLAANAVSPCHRRIMSSLNPLQWHGKCSADTAHVLCSTMWTQRAWATAPVKRFVSCLEDKLAEYGLMHMRSTASDMQCHTGV